MSGCTKGEWFDGIENIVSDPLRFKAKLAIGEDAYTSLRVKNATFELWDVAGVASTAVAVAKSSAVASTFFASNGILSLGGLIGTATTPVGWVVAAGVLAGGGWIGITRYIKQSSSSKVTVIPNFINTPMDVLALGLFDLMAPLALKVASIDGEICDDERSTILSYFVEQWGYDGGFVREGITFTEKRLSDFSIKNLAHSLAEFKKQNKDCNYKVMSRELINFLREIIEADGRIDEREEMAIEKVEQVFDEVDRYNFKKVAKDGFDSVSEVARKMPFPALLCKKK
ncbi:TerB family tellurite resistance protein [Trichloromonas sp.]|uniref:TerB family tellurite resistance protein n=1 Tax=Trichloromonas sp. TaxID=3069249 RepID=UPI003D81956D